MSIVAVGLLLMVAAVVAAVLFAVLNYRSRELRDFYEEVNGFRDLPVKEDSDV